MPKKDKPRFSVVIPCYNEAAYISAALKSLHRQNFGGQYEIIVVDNNSTDNTVAIAKNLGAHVVLEKHPGVCWARQKGTQLAKGEIIISTDADTTFSTNWLKQIDEVFNNNPEIVAVTGPCQYNGGPLWGRVYAKMLFGLISFSYKITGRVSYAPAVNLAFKKSIWDGYNTVMTQMGDEMDLLRKLRRKGKVIFDNKLVVYTSPRRLRQGFFYNVFISFFLYSVLEYNLNRLFKRRFFGQAPAFRDDDESKEIYT
jgi:glycosyltransferase involved in cell wall biosynthesis